MNAFTEMRRRYFDSKSEESFAEYYLAHRCYVSEEDDAARYQLRNKIAFIRSLSSQNTVGEAELLGMLHEIGENLYLDRYIIAWLVSYPDQLRQRAVQNALAAMLNEQNSNPLRFSGLLDICLECELPLLRAERLHAALLTYRQDFDVFSVLLEYVQHFSVNGFAEMLYDFLGAALPVNIKIQIIDILISGDPDPLDVVPYLRQKLIADENWSLYHAYLSFRREKKLKPACGIVVVQPMFYGDPEDSGKGKSGGLGTLLKTLGNQLSRQQQISQVFTLTIHQEWSEQKSFLRQYEPGHWLVRLPVYWNADDPQAFVKRELSIKRAVARFLRQQQIEPDLFHIRYLDNASRAMALLSKQLGSKLVFTLTPDPHRNMVDANGDILCYKVEETLEKLNKITIGDELLSMTDGIVGIGGDSVKEELELYFPQLNQAQQPAHIRMIGEGIVTQVDAQNFDVWRFLDDHSLGFRIDPNNQKRPVILNVGRLNRQKGQQNLLKAWGESRLSEDFNLILIGGNRENKEAEEQQITAFFDAFLTANPHLIGRFAHVEALPNEEIRRIERKLMEGESADYPNIYVCSSAKEEFGISILEALSEGYLTFVPVKGGAKTYLVNGVNGFLVDTASDTTLRQGMEQALYHQRRSRSDFKKIQHAGKRTVLDQFSIEEIAKRFLELYLGLSDGSEMQCIANGSLFS